MDTKRGEETKIPDSHKQIAADITSIVAGVCVLGLLSFVMIYGA